jgi:uncharacterized protein (DUF1684 family)
MAPNRADPLSDWSAGRARRAASLRAPDGWLALSGLHWLDEGENHLPGLPGTFLRRGTDVTLRAAPADGYHLSGAPVVERALRSDAVDRADRLRLGSRTVGIIQRGPEVAVRVWDAESPALRDFRGIPCFPYQPSWRIEARWEPYPAPREVEQPAAAGPPQRAVAPGRAHFELHGRALALEPTLESSGRLHFVFRDATAPRETYGAGRFLYAPPPAAGVAVLDFNRALNPPCAFSPWATCPLPSPENVLPERIEAGEKSPLDHE